MIKKSLTAVFALLLSFAFGTGAFAAGNEDTQKALQLIDTANAAIDTEINEAAADAEQLLNGYIQDIASVKGTERLESLYNKQTALEGQLRESTDETEKAAINTELEKIFGQIDSAADTLSTQSAYFAERTAAYQTALNALIAELDQTTRQLTADAIAEAAEFGVTAECSWKYVKIGHKWVWIDPVRVVEG